jgi:hypothetical protein
MPRASFVAAEEKTAPVLHEPGSVITELVRQERVFMAPHILDRRAL